MLQPGEVFEVDASTVDGSVKMLRREEGGWVPLVEPPPGLAAASFRLFVRPDDSLFIAIWKRISLSLRNLA